MDADATLKRQAEERIRSKQKGLWCHPCQRPFSTRPNYLQHQRARHGYTGPIGSTPRACPHCGESLTRP